jgi:hypothetical protein
MTGRSKQYESIFFLWAGFFVLHVYRPTLHDATIGHWPRFWRPTNQKVRQVDPPSRICNLECHWLRFGEPTT